MKRWIIGLGNDELGYIVPEYDFVLAETMPWVNEAEGNHYEETNSLGPNMASIVEEFADLLMEDQKIRKFIHKKYKFAGIPKVEIERTRDEVKVILHAARPGVIIGRKGQEVEQLQDELQNLVGRRINIKIEEVSRPEL